MTQRNIQWWLRSALLTLGLVTPLTQAEEYLYRYVNKEGVKVITNTIPPEYSQRGYDVINSSGQLLKTVEPAPSDGEIAKENAERMLREKFSVLKRRFSSEEDIEAAKIRRLKNIETNISILKGNVSSINVRIENLMREAADVERAGREVSSNLLQQIKDTRAELAVTESALDKRLEEHRVVAERFEKDLATFSQGRALFSEAESFN